MLPPAISGSASFQLWELEDEISVPLSGCIKIAMDEISVLLLAFQALFTENIRLDTPHIPIGCAVRALPLITP